MNRILSALILLLPATVIAGDWPQFLGPQRSSRADDEGKLIHTMPKKGPPVLWERKVGDGYSAPVIKGNRLILFHRIDNKDLVECLNASTGKLIWKFDYPTKYEDALSKGDGPRSTPLIAGDHVYTLSADGRLHCLTLEKGTKVWMRNLSRDYAAPQGYFGVSTSPILEGDLIVINIGGRGAGIVALNKTTGKTVWTSPNHQRSYASPIAASIDSVRHLFFFTREGLVSLDPKTGKTRFSRRWRARIDASVNATSPILIGNHLFLTSSYRTGAFVAEVKKDGLKVLWENDESLSSHFSPAVHDGDYIYGFDGRQEEGARLRCIEWKTGKVKWSKDRFGCGAMILADGELIILTEEGDLVLVECTPQAYREKGRAKIFDGLCRAHIALSQGRLYARDTNKLVCLDLRKK